MENSKNSVDKLIQVLAIEHFVIIRWADEIALDIKNDEEIDIYAKIVDFGIFILQHILKEDAQLYPDLSNYEGIDTEVTNLHDIYHVLEEFFGKPPGVVLSNFEEVAQKIKARISYEEGLFILFSE